MDITELTELLRVVKDIAPDVKWDTDDDGNVVILTYLPLNF